MKTKTSSFQDFIYSLADGYGAGSKYILHLFLTFGVIYILVNTISIATRTVSKVALSSLLVSHLIIWVCWMIKEGTSEEPDMKGGKKR